MKTTIHALILILISVSLYGQNENPYSVFGYEAPIMAEKAQSVDKLLLINQDSTSSVWMLSIDPSKRIITIFARNKTTLQYDTLTNYTMMRWLSPDPYGQFSSPYMGMGNTPNMSADPDGGWSWIMAGVGFAAGAGAALLTGNEDDWWKWGLVGGVAGGISFNQDHLGATKFNGGYREYGGLRIPFNTKLYRGIGDIFKSNWTTVANAGLRQVGQGGNSQYCVYCSEESVERWLGGNRNKDDFSSLQNGGTPQDRGPGTVGDWLSAWRRNFSGNFEGGILTSSSPPNVRDVIRNMNNNRVYSVVTHEPSHPAGYDHNVLINKVQRNTKTKIYRYKLMDPNGSRTELASYVNSVHRRHVVIRR